MLELQVKVKLPSSSPFSPFADLESEQELFKAWKVGLPALIL